MKNGYSAVSAYDMHYPHTNKPTVRAMFQFVDFVKPKIFIKGGDQLDLGCISHHNKNKPLYRTKGAYMKDVTGYDRDILAPLEKLLPKDAEKVWIYGNHEDWERQAIEEQPELAELLDHARILRLKERGWKIVEMGYAHKVGKLSYIHGEWVTGFGNQGPVATAKKLVEVFAGNVVGGHTHSPQSFARVSPISQKERWMGWVSPVLCDLNPMYARNRPKAWVNGWNVTEFHPDGCFNHYPVIASKGRASYGGRVFG